MNSYLIDMLLCGLAYVIMVYFMMRLMRNSERRLRKDDEGDGGINLSKLPEVDLPPGITLPDGSFPKKKEKFESKEVLI